MRNKEFYLVILKQKSKEWAYDYITENLKRPDFIYEPQNAYAAYKEVYGIEFASPQERQAISDKEEIERLKAELELAKIAQKKEAAKTAEVIETPPPVADDNPVMTKELFKELHPELKGLDLHRAWVKYAKEKGIPK